MDLGNIEQIILEASKETLFIKSKINEEVVEVLKDFHQYLRTYQVDNIF